MQGLARLAAALLAAFLLPGVLSAAAFKIFPVRMTLSADEPVQTMTVTNDSDEPTRVQLRVYAWRQDAEGRDIFEDTRDVLANPALFELAPRGEQIARFGLRTQAGASEKSYRLFLEEVPTDRPSLPGEVRTLLRVSVPIFVAPPDPAARLNWRAVPSGAGQVGLVVRNDGNAHIQLNRLTVKRAGRAAASEDVSVYVLPGATKRVMLDVRDPPRVGEAFKVEAVTDGADVAVDLVMEAAAREAGSP